MDKQLLWDIKQICILMIRRFTNWQSWTKVVIYNHTIGSLLFCGWCGNRQPRRSLASAVEDLLHSNLLIYILINRSPIYQWWICFHHLKQTLPRQGKIRPTQNVAWARLPLQGRIHSPCSDSKDDLTVCWQRMARVDRRIVFRFLS